MNWNAAALISRFFSSPLHWLAMLALLASSAGCAPPTPVFRVSGGSIQGKVVGSTNVFLGIPYAAPPVGDRRFAPPEPVLPWQGTKATTAAGPSCPQILIPGLTPPTFSEDCLTLNVFAPKNAPSHGLPVMAFIHGGGFVQGGSANYAAESLSEAAGAVVVTMNYRLGVLGFMAHPSLDAALGMPSGNMGLRDQQLALKWIQDNITSFGGDPTNVTLFGESAGSVSTCLHMVLTGSESLAQKFIMESGSCVAGPVGIFTRDMVVEQANALITALCPDASDTVACLRNLPADTLGNWYPSGLGAQVSPFWPYIDGALIAAHPAQLIREGHFNRSPFIVGTNLHEWRLFQATYALAPSVPWPSGWAPVETRDALAAEVSELYPDEAPAITAHYQPASDAEANDAFVRLQTDAYFRCPTRALIRAAVQQGSRASLYSFEVSPAAHAQDIDYVFNIPAVSLLFPNEAPFPPLPGVVKAMQTYWGNFAKTSDPNGAGQVAWPRYEQGADQHLSIADPVSVGSGLARADCDFWDQVYARGH